MMMRPAQFASAFALVGAFVASPALAEPVVVSSAAAPPAATAEPPLRLLRGPSYAIALSPEAKSVSIRAPIELAKKLQADELDLSIVDVWLDQSSSSDLAPKLQATLGASALVLTGPAEFLRAPGPYHVRLRLARKGTNEYLQAIDLELDHAEAHVVAEPLIIERVVTGFWAGAGATSISGNVLRFRETTGRTQATPVTFRSSTPLGSNGLPASGVLNAPPDRAPVSIAAGGSIDVEATVVGNFPLGEARGTLEIQSPQLRAPTPVVFTVHSRVSRWWLLGALLGGLVFSWSLRVILKQRIDRGLLDERIGAVLEAIERESWRPDVKLRDKLDAARAPLDGLYGKPAAKAEDVNEAIMQAKGALAEALADFAQRSTETTRELDQLESSTSHPAGPLPPAMLAALEGNAPLLLEVRPLLSEHNISGAAERLSTIREKVANAVRQCAQSWHREANRALADLDEVGRDLPELESGGATTGEARASLDALKVATGLSDIVDKTRATWAELNELADRRIVQLAAYAGRVADKLPGEHAGSIRHAEAELRQFSTSDATQPQLLARVVRAHRSLAQTVRDTLSPLARLLPEQERAQFTAQLEGRMYLVGAAMLTSATGEGGLRERGYSRRLVFEAAIAQAPMPEADRPAAPPSLGQATPSKMAPQARPRVNPGVRETAARQLSRDRYLQDVAGILLVAAAGFLVFFEKFVGSPSELITILGWAFGANLGVGGVLDALKSGSKPS
jgi:hypothetical protein